VVGLMSMPLATAATISTACGAKRFAVVGCTVARGRIVAIDLITNPDRLGGVTTHR
jgi:hypothetical protein